MPSIMRTICPTISPPRPARPCTLPAMSLACTALPLFCCTVAASCSMLDAVCCRAEACASVRPDKSILPAAISWLAMLMRRKLPRTSPTMECRFTRSWRKERSNCPISSRRVVSSSPVRSPPAITSQAWRARCSGCSTARCKLCQKYRVAHKASADRPVSQPWAAAGNAPAFHASCSSNTRLSKPRFQPMRWASGRSRKRASLASQPVRTAAPWLMTMPSACPALMRAYRADACATCWRVGLVRTDM
ncbi:hypothetical protein JAB2_42650 [Janthinobacterium sp. HH100]|nr:hypothetical protein JAB2_42650 [Janthinobacterium sp. HH100]